MAQFTPPLDDGLPMAPAPAPLVGGDPWLPQQQPQGMPFDAGRMGLGLDVLEGWTRQATSAPEPDYQGSPFLTVGGSAMSAGGSRGAEARQATAGQGVNISQHWILSDSARWHHNFEGWDMDEQVPAEWEGLTASMGGVGWLPALD